MIITWEIRIGDKVWQQPVTVSDAENPAMRQCAAEVIGNTVRALLERELGVSAEMPIRI
jgi:hypothetical protein